MMTQGIAISKVCIMSCFLMAFSEQREGDAELAKHIKGAGWHT